MTGQPNSSGRSSGAQMWVTIEDADNLLAQAREFARRC